MQALLPTAKAHTNPTHSTHLLGNGDAVVLDLFPDLARAFMECPTHLLPAGSLLAKASQVVDLVDPAVLEVLEVQVRGTASAIHLVRALKDTQVHLANPCEVQCNRTINLLRLVPE